MADAPDASDELVNLYSFAVWTYGTREAATAMLVTAIRAVPDGRRNDWLRLLWQGRPALRRRGTMTQLQALDGVLRDQMTVPVGLDHPLVRGEPRRLDVLRSEVKRVCLTTVVRALAPSQRAVLLLEALFGMSPAEMAELTGMTVDNVHATQRKAVRTLDDYLASRCEHLDPRNFCRCDGRVGLALARGFIDWPEHHEHDEAPAARRGPGLPALLASLPRFRPDARVTAVVDERIGSPRKGAP